MHLYLSLSQTSVSSEEPRQIKYVTADAFSSPPCLCKVVSVVVTWTISFLLPRRLLSVFIEMKGSFDVRF